MPVNFKSDSIHQIEQKDVGNLYQHLLMHRVELQQYRLFLKGRIGAKIIGIPAHPKLQA